MFNSVNQAYFIALLKPVAYKKSGRDELCSSRVKYLHYVTELGCGLPNTLIIHAAVRVMYGEIEGGGG